MAEVISHTGAFSCYCNSLIEQGYDLKTTNQTIGWTEEDGSKTIWSDTTCYYVYKEALSTTSAISLWSMGFPYFVTINTFLIRTAMLWVAKQLRFTNLTKETNMIMLSIFFMSLFNYGFVYIFAAWDSREAKLNFIQGFFGGLYTDLNAYWFNDVGLMICSTMTFNMYYPLLEFVGFWALRWLYRAVD